MAYHAKLALSLYKPSGIPCGIPLAYHWHTIENKFKFLILLFLLTYMEKKNSKFVFVIFSSTLYFFRWYADGMPMVCRMVCRSVYKEIVLVWHGMPWYAAIFLIIKYLYINKKQRHTMAYHANQHYSLINRAAYHAAYHRHTIGIPSKINSIFLFCYSF